MWRLNLVMFFYLQTIIPIPAHVNCPASIHLPVLRSVIHQVHGLTLIIIFFRIFIVLILVPGEIIRMYPLAPIHTLHHALVHPI